MSTAAKWFSANLSFTSASHRMIRTFVNDWIKTSPFSKHATIEYAIEETNTLTGSVCCLKVSSISDMTCTVNLLADSVSTDIHHPRINRFPQHPI